jgi:hypothetical protein
MTTTIIELHNVKSIMQNENPIVKSRVYGKNNINNYKLINDVVVRLSDGKVITISKGYVWDLASVPRWLWALVPPDSDAELAFVLHDFLYENHIELGYDQEFCDNEMKLWSEILNGTKNISLRNLDNTIRFLAVKWFGKKVFNKNKK